MKHRTALALAAAAATAALAAAAIPALAAPGATRHTLHFNAVQIASHHFSKTSYAELDKDFRAGKVIATNEIDWSGSTATAVLALNRGFLYGQFAFISDTSFAGKVTGGTGAYKGDTGTITGHADSATEVTVTVNYQS
jgi:hypothetical protein